jgi:ArsR family transcriptional regulator
MDVDETSGLFRLLGDSARLRLLRILSREALNVSELTAVLGLAQSGVSRHLGLLREAGLVVEARAGGYTWYRLASDLAGSSEGRGPLWDFVHREFARVTPATQADDARLQEVRRVRKERFADHGANVLRGQLVPGRSWAAWSRALGLLLPPLDVVDIGCGDGFLAIEAAGWARSVVAVDRSAAVLARARALGDRRRASNIAWKRGEMERLPLSADSVDVALLSQALHHADDPARVLAEAHRVVRPGGRIVVLDLREHSEAWVASKLGDRWLGFSEKQLRELIAAAGFADIIVRVGSRAPDDPFVVLIAAGTKPAEAGPSARQQPCITRSTTS